MQTNSIWESRSQLVQTSMAVIHNSRTSSFEKGTLPYMAPDELMLKISLNTSTFQLSSMFIPYILWQFLLSFLIRGLVFSPHKFFTAKNKIHAPKENQCTTLWHFNGFLSHEMIHLFFLIVGETLFRPRCWFDIHRNLASNILPSHFSEESVYFGEKIVFPVFSTLDPAFSTRPRVFHQTPSFPLPGNPCPGPWIFHKLLPRPRGIITS